LSIYLAIFGKPRYMGLFDLTDLPREKLLVAETMRGTELAALGGPLSPEQEERYRNACGDEFSDGQVKGGEPSLQEITYLREATDEDINEAALAREEEDAVLLKAREILQNHKLAMKLVDVEFLLDRKKLFFYFTSEQRVDFRAFVRDLAKEFKTRIELRQIGVRDEAKAVKGLGPCGRRCCCSSWLHRFTPICIKMVKEQNLALNPTKISGICGRLMCCMSYEHHLYGELWKGLPNPGSKIKTPTGNYLMDGVELSSESIRVRSPEGKEILVKVADFAQFREKVTAGEAWEPSGFRELSAEAAEERARPPKRRTAEIKAEPASAPVKPSFNQEKRRGPEKVPAERPSPEKTDIKQIPSEDGGGKKKRRRKKPAPRPVKGDTAETSAASAAGLDKAKEKQPSSDAQRKKSQARRRRPPRGAGENRGAPQNTNSSASGE
jgi:cell fate regulator YaaT (PSP1 superfamily)